MDHLLYAIPGMPHSFKLSKKCWTVQVSGNFILLISFRKPNETVQRCMKIGWGVWVTPVPPEFGGMSLLVSWSVWLTIPLEPTNSTAPRRLQCLPVIQTDWTPPSAGTDDLIRAIAANAEQIRTNFSIHYGTSSHEQHPCSVYLRIYILLISRIQSRN